MYRGIFVNQFAWVLKIFLKSTVKTDQQLAELEGVTYYEGDLMQEDECHSCYCSRGEKKCKGQPCSTTEPPIFTTEQHEQDVQCVSGWTSWINQDKVRISKSKSTRLTFICFLQIAKSKKKKNQKVKLTDIEPLPTAIILNNLKTRSKCNIDKMVSIECLTIDGRHPKDLDLDVECSLERGLVCK